jgi:hypothetical protein
MYEKCDETKFNMPKRTGRVIGQPLKAAKMHLFKM